MPYMNKMAFGVPTSAFEKFQAVCLENPNIFLQPDDNQVEPFDFTAWVREEGGKVVKRIINSQDLTAVYFDSISLGRRTFEAQVAAMEGFIAQTEEIVRIIIGQNDDDIETYHQIDSTTGLYGLFRLRREIEIAPFDDAS